MGKNWIQKKKTEFGKKSNGFHRALTRSDRPTKITPRAQCRFIQEVIKEPRTTFKELQASLASIKVSVHDSTIRKRLGKNGIHGRVPRQKPKNNTKAHLTFAKKCIIPKTFGQIFCGLTRQKLNFLEGLCPVTSGVKPTKHFIKRTSCQQSNMVAVVWWSEAALQLQDLDDLP